MNKKHFPCDEIVGYSEYSSLYWDCMNFDKIIERKSTRLWFRLRAWQSLTRFGVTAGYPVSCTSPAVAELKNELRAARKAEQYIRARAW